MNNISSPMLACSLLKPNIPHTDENILLAMKKLNYPVLASVKMDGVRALRMRMPYLASRTFKWIPNTQLCGRAMELPIGLDMELWNPDMEYNDIQSLVMSEDAYSSAIQFHVIDLFDYPVPGTTYINRCHAIDNLWIQYGKKFHWQFPVECSYPEELFAYFTATERIGGEGICFRSPSSTYKEGRSTLREQGLVKLCRYTFSEVTVIGFTEQMHNENIKKRNAVDKMDRSKAIDGMVAKNTLGSFIVKDDSGLEFSVGTGMTDALRLSVWDSKEAWLGQRITIRSKAHGVKIKPRSPTYWGQRKEGY